MDTATTTPAETVLTRLRSETRPSHERAESAVGMPTSLDAHADTLAGFLGFLEPWERAIAPSIVPLVERLAGRGKAQLLVNDLIALGWTTDAIARLPRCDSLPRVDSLPRALGSMYVFEGATLGGVLVARHVEHAFGLHDGIGYSFHRSYGPRVGEMWRAFGKVVLDVAGTPTDSPSAADEIVAGARDTFDALCLWFESRAPISPR